MIIDWIESTHGQIVIPYHDLGRAEAVVKIERVDTVGCLGGSVG